MAAINTLYFKVCEFSYTFHIASAIPGINFTLLLQFLELIFVLTLSINHKIKQQTIFKFLLSNRRKRAYTAKKKSCWFKYGWKDGWERILILAIIHKNFAEKICKWKKPPW